MKNKDKTEQISVRIDRATKVSAERVFDRLGLSPTNAVRMFYQQVAQQRGLPFVARIPNKATRAALQELREGKGKVSRNVEEFYRDMGI